MRYKIVYGGRGSGKSWGIAIILLFMGMAEKKRILCVREFQGSIADSVHKLLCDIINKFDLHFFYEVQKTTIKGRNGTEFIFMGIQRNPSKVKSTEGIDVCWFEEADNASDESLDLLIPTIRKENSELWFSLNPQFEDDPVYKRLILSPPDNARLIFVNYWDNPFFPDVLRGEMRYDQRVNDAKYRHIWCGECKDVMEGEVWKIDQFCRYTTLPYGDAVQQVIHSWDTAYKEDQHNDPSCGQVWTTTRSQAYLTHNINERMGYPELRSRVLSLAENHKPDAVLIEDKASGQSLIQDLRANSTLPIIPIQPKNNKETRARAAAHAVEAQKIVLPYSANWLASYERELAVFPSEKHHDDQVDATSQFINWWTKNTGTSFGDALQEIYR